MLTQVNARCRCRCVTRRGRGRSPLPLFKNWKKGALILRTNALIVVIYGLEFSFKMQFLRVFRRKNRTDPFFLVLYMIAYQGALTPQNLPCPKKFLVARLGWLLLLISFASVIFFSMWSRSSFRVIQK